jgi:hypothetical protein
MTRASSPRSQQTVTLRRQVEVRTILWLKCILLLGSGSLLGSGPLYDAAELAGAVGTCVRESRMRMPVTIYGWIAIMESMVMSPTRVTVIRSPAPHHMAGPASAATSTSQQQA